MLDIAFQKLGSAFQALILFVLNTQPFIVFVAMMKVVFTLINPEKFHYPEYASLVCLKTS